MMTNTKRAATREAERIQKQDIVNGAAILSPAEQNAAAMAGTVPDSLNPAFLFALTDSAVLAAIVAGRIDVRAVAERELANRGLDFAGRFVGFTTAGRS